MRAYAFVALLAVGMTYRLFRMQGLARVMTWAGGLQPQPAWGNDIGAVERAVRWAQWWQPYSCTCLQRAAALFVILRVLRCDAMFRLGVQECVFLAHAWVEHSERVLLEPLPFVHPFRLLMEIR